MNKKGSSKTLLLLAILATALMITVASIAVPIILIGHFVTGHTLDKATGQLPVNVGDACITPLWPNVTDNAKFAAAIDEYVKKVSPNAPLNGLGTDFVSGAQAAGINPAWEINIARKESTFGIHIPPGSFNSFGRTAAAGQPSVSFNGRNWYKYDSFQASAAPQATYLKGEYIDKGLTTFEAITNKYAPPSENDTQGYIKEIKQWVGQAMTIASNEGAVNCAGSTSQTPAS